MPPVPSLAVSASSRTPSPGFAAGLRSAKLIEARFRVFDPGRRRPAGRCPEDVVVLIESPQRRLRVADFSPKTEMANSVDGEVQTTRTTEKTATAGAQIGGGTLPPLYGLASATVGGSQHHVVAQTVK